MRFLLDMNLPPLLGELLAQHGHSWRWMGHFENPGLSDMDIVVLARFQEEVILTHDLDFGDLLAFSAEAKPSVVIFRIHRISAEIFYQLLQDNWLSIRQPLEDGAIVVIEKASIRIRKLPVSRS